MRGEGAQLAINGSRLLQELDVPSAPRALRWLRSYTFRRYAEYHLVSSDSQFLHHGNEKFAD
ncbi:UNVERIFIED_CONTAM: hypothetical protein Slati_0615800 [Sesamum latifolium]|uniref:Uncharacterized protein n=1 Tax=Sesamum latifolium TaxID=2727402 RepID=A0AAW2Y2K8_9LAMI